MKIWYDEKIENLELDYILYLDLLCDKEYWLVYSTGILYHSEEAGEVLVSRLGNKYLLKERIVLWGK